MKKILVSLLAMLLILTVMVGKASCGKNKTVEVSFIVDGESYRTVEVKKGESQRVGQSPVLSCPLVG